MKKGCLKMDITVVGAGYVGLANAFLLGLKNNVMVIDLNEEKINKLKKGIMTINDNYIEKYKTMVNVNYDINGEKYYDNSDLIIIATNTDFDENSKKFNVSSIETVMFLIDKAAVNSKNILIKSTIPIGFTESLQKKFPKHNIYFSPEFLREGYALYDNLYPDRIVIGGNKNVETKKIANLLHESIKKDDVPIIYTSNKEAEIIKLFSNTYLAMRVAFVNEVDTFCQSLELDTKSVINAIGCDHRIGTHYFNPSFGYGGYCLPKDSKQLYQEYEKNGVKSSLMKSIIDSNKIRKDFIAQIILDRTNRNDVIGIYRLLAKKGINNFRAAAIIDVVNILKNSNRNIIIFDPLFEDKEFLGCNVEGKLDDFIKKSDLIVANRIDDQIRDFANVYSVDIYEEN